MPFSPLFIIDRWDGGAFSDDFAENINKNQSPNPRGIDFFGKSFRKAKGYTAFGTEAETVAGFGFYNHKTIVDSDEVIVKTVGTKLKFYDETTGVHHPFYSGAVTAGLRWAFWSFNGYLYGSNATDGFFRWRASSWGKLEGAISAGATSIVLESGQGARFATSGSGLIEGDTFAWTGKSTDTLTGVTGVSSSHADGVRVIAEADFSSYTSNPKGFIGAFFKNRSFVVDAANPSTIYHSKLADTSDPQGDIANFTIAGSGSGDAGFVIAPDRVMVMKQYISSSNTNSLIIICADGVAYDLSVSDSGGTTVASIIPVKVLNAAPVTENMAATLENELMLVDHLNDIRSVGYSSETNSILRTARVSDGITPTIDPELISFTTSGHMAYAKRRIFILGKQGGSSLNNFAIQKDTNPEAFSFYDHWQFNAIIENKGSFYGLSSMNANVYKLFDGLSADGDPIRAAYPTMHINFGNPLIYKNLRFVRLSGFISSNCTLKVKIYMDTDQTPIAVYNISGTDTDIVDAVSGVALGTVVFGGNTLGGATTGSELKRFFATLNLPTLKHFYTCQVVFENEEADVDFMVDKALFFAEPTAPELQKLGAYLVNT